MSPRGHNTSALKWQRIVAAPAAGEPGELNRVGNQVRAKGVDPIASWHSEFVGPVVLGPPVHALVGAVATQPQRLCAAAGPVAAQSADDDLHTPVVVPGADIKPVGGLGGPREAYTAPARRAPSPWRVAVPARAAQLDVNVGGNGPAAGLDDVGGDRQQHAMGLVAGGADGDGELVEQLAGNRSAARRAGAGSGPCAVAGLAVRRAAVGGHRAAAGGNHVSVAPSATPHPGTRHVTSLRGGRFAGKDGPASLLSDAAGLDAS